MRSVTWLFLRIPKETAWPCIRITNCIAKQTRQVSVGKSNEDLTGFYSSLFLPALRTRYQVNNFSCDTSCQAFFNSSEICITGSFPCVSLYRCTADQVLNKPMRSWKPSIFSIVNAGAFISSKGKGMVEYFFSTSLFSASQ